MVSAAARLTTGRADLTVVVVPYFTPSRTPLSDSRWVPMHPEDVGAIVDGREVPRIRTFTDVEYAGRLRGTIGGWDLSLSYFDGFERTPVLKLVGVEPTPTGDLPHYTPVFTRVMAPGVDFSTTFGSIEIHGEGALKLVKRDGRNDVFQGIAGVNYRLDAPGTVVPVPRSAHFLPRRGRLSLRVRQRSRRPYRPGITDRRVEPSVRHRCAGDRRRDRGG